MDPLLLMDRAIRWHLRFLMGQQFLKAL